MIFQGYRKWVRRIAGMAYNVVNSDYSSAKSNILCTSSAKHY